MRVTKDLIEQAMALHAAAVVVGDATEADLKRLDDLGGLTEKFALGAVERHERTSASDDNAVASAAPVTGFSTNITLAISSALLRSRSETWVLTITATRDVVLGRRAQKASTSRP